VPDVLAFLSSAPQKHQELRFIQVFNKGQTIRLTLASLPGDGVMGYQVVAVLKFASNTSCISLTLNVVTIFYVSWVQIRVTVSGIVGG
jgi:hypothetical protein